MRPAPGEARVELLENAIPSTVLGLGKACQEVEGQTMVTNIVGAFVGSNPGVAVMLDALGRGGTVSLLRCRAMQRVR